MYAISQLQDRLGIVILVMFVAGLIALLAGLLWRPPSSKRAPKSVCEGYRFLGKLRFFLNRSDFYYDGIASSSSGHFSFHLGDHKVVGVSGIEGRKLFYESKALSMYEGVYVFFPTIPSIEDTNEPSASDPRWASKTIIAMMRNEYLNKNLPLIVGDVRRHIKDLIVTADGPVFLDPFQEMYQMVYQLTMRTFGADDIADSPELLNRTRALFEQIEASFSPARVIFPWLPTPAHLRRKAAAEGLYTIFKNIILKRTANGARGNDALQYLVDKGSDTKAIIPFILDTLFGGLFNSGLNAAWMFVYLACNARWYKIVQHEVDKAVATHRTSPGQTPEYVLTTLTLEQWESEFPMIDLCLRECIRLQLVGTGFRKNVSGRDLPLGKTGEVIPANAFVIYLIDEVHMDPDIYPNPEHWDPSRYLPGRAEDRKQPLGWLGWGMGRNPCLGMRFAKLEMAIMGAFFMATFDFKLVDPDGTKIGAAPKVNRNNHAISKPDVSVRLQYTLR